MSWASLAAGGIGAIGSVAGGLISQAGNRAAAGQLTGAAAGEQAYNRSLDAGQLDVGRLSPWTASGTAAAQQINALLGLGSLQSTGDKYNNFNVAGGYSGGDWQQAQKDAMARFQTDPGYQFRLQQGVNALSNSAAARGGTFSGAQAKALSDYGQKTGSAEYGNYFNRLAGVSEQGRGAATSANSAYNQAVVPGINAAFTGAVGQGDQAAAYTAAGQNALASGVVGGVNSLVAGGMSFPWGGGGSGGGLANGAQVPGGISGNAFGGYNYPPVNLA